MEQPAALGVCGSRLQGTEWLLEWTWEERFLFIAQVGKLENQKEG